MRLIFNLKAKRQTDEQYTVLKAAVQDTQWELYTALLSASLDESFYRVAGSPSAANQAPGNYLPSIREYIRQHDPFFTARLAVYCSESLHLRALSFILSAELTVLYGDREWAGHKDQVWGSYEDGEWLSLLLNRILRQAGDIPEWMAYYARANAKKGAYKHKPGKQVLKGLSLVFNRLEEYQFTRYSKDEQLRLKKALLLVRPKGKDKTQRILFGKIRKDQLSARTSWQQEWNAIAQQQFDTAELKQIALREKWKEGISSFRIGYAALLDHLPSILAAGVSGKVLKLAAEYLGNIYAVADSGLSPYRLLEAARKLRSMDQGGARLLLDALELAVRHSARNMAGFEAHTRTVVAMDVSNSMKYPVREGSLLQRFDIAPLLAMLLADNRRPLIAGIIGNTWKPISLSAQNILAAVEAFRSREGEVGYAINAHLVIQDLLRKRIIADKVMIFTDCRVWDNRVFHQQADADCSRVWKLYRQMAPSAKLYLFDLAGYGNKPLEVLQEGVFLISGWNEDIFNVLTFVGKEADILEKINQIAL